MGVMSGTYGLVMNGANVIAQIRNWSMSRQTDIQEYTVLGTAGYKNKRPTFKNVNVQCDLYWDPSDTDGQVALETAWGSAATLTLRVYPSADTSGTPAAGDVYYEGSAYVSDLSISGDAEGLVEGAASFAIDGAMTRGVET